MTSAAGAALASWNDGAVKSEILDFVARVTTEGGPDFVPEADRVATFDNDGTLWGEQPLQVQVFFLIDRVKALAAADPSLNDRQPYKALLDQDFKTLIGYGKPALLELAFATHAGMTEEAFEDAARTWLATAKHPRLGRRFVDCTYQPQRELLDLLQTNGFKTFIVTGGGVDFVRTVAADLYGVQREQVIGSSVRTRFEMQDGRGRLLKLAQLGSFNDAEAKPQNIGLQIGRRPLLAFGNSDGDLAMLRYAKTGPGARLALLLHHDDADREVAYDRDFGLSPLAEALDRAKDYGLTLVSMKRDWATVFAPAPA